MSRLACLWVPLFPLAARLRAEPELAGEALAVTAGNGATAQIVAATRVARRLGVTPGMTLAQARALVPRLAARHRDDACERAAQEALAEVAERFSPRVEIAGPGLLFLDADALAGRFRPGPRAQPGWTPERELGRRLAAGARHAGLPARVGIAGSKLAAQVAAQTAGSPGSHGSHTPDAASDDSEPRIVASGKEAGFLAPLPLARLAPELSLGETLARWGLTSIGDFARLPAADVASRLGPSGTELHTVARGIDPRPLLPREPPLDLAEGSELEWPLTTLEPFLFLAHAALDRIVRRLELRGLGCTRLALELTLEPVGRDVRAWDLPAPTRDPKTLLTVVRLDLEARPPGASRTAEALEVSEGVMAIAAFLFTATPDRTRPEQGTLFGPPALSPERLATTLARLFALLGPDRVGSPRPVDGHRPERLSLVPFAPPAAPLLRHGLPRQTPASPTPSTPSSPSTPSGKGLLAVRTLRPPIALEVLLEPRPADREPAPTHVQSLATEANGRRPTIAGAVRVAAGPWRLEEGWWGDAPTAREYWDVELEAAGLFRIYRDVATGDWSADGVYD